MAPRRNKSRETERRKSFYDIAQFPNEDLTGEANEFTENAIASTNCQFRIRVIGIVRFSSSELRLSKIPDNYYLISPLKKL